MLCRNLETRFEVLEAVNCALIPDSHSWIYKFYVGKLMLTHHLWVGLQVFTWRPFSYSLLTAKPLYEGIDTFAMSLAAVYLPLAHTPVP